MEIVRSALTLSQELSPPIDFIAPVFAKAVLDYELWHRRFTHAGWDSCKRMLFSTQTYATGITCVGPHSASPWCTGCLLGKHARPSFQEPANRAEDLNELLHMDTCGLFPTASFERFLHAWVIVDDKSNWGESRGLRQKSDVYTAMVEIIAAWERQMDLPVRRVRCDVCAATCALRRRARIHCWSAHGLL
ncbi:hypothetical protein EV714DRAFT_222167 [Schizophyllum commune]